MGLRLEEDIHLEVEYHLVEDIRPEMEHRPVVGHHPEEERLQITRSYIEKAAEACSLAILGEASIMVYSRPMVEAISCLHEVVKVIRRDYNLEQVEVRNQLGVADQRYCSTFE